MYMLVSKGMIFGILSLFGCSAVANEYSVIEFLRDQPQYSTLVKHLETTGLDVGLGLPLNWKWTIFAPTNDAFESLSKDMREGFDNDPQLLKNLLIDHLLVGELSSNAVDESKKTLTVTVSQKSLELYRDSDLYVKDMIVVEQDQSADNGVIHGINCVMFVQKSKKDDRLTPQTQDQYPITACCLNAGMHDSDWRENYTNTGRSHSSN